MARRQKRKPQSFVQFAGERFYAVLFGQERNAFLFFIGSLVLIVAMFSYAIEGVTITRSGQQDLPGRIARLSYALLEATKSIGDIEKEIQARQKLANQLRKDAETAQNLIALNEPQVQAIAQSLRGQLEEKERESYWWNIAQNVGFAFLGALLGELLRFFVRRKKGF
jgi:hypothetical protein